MAHIPVGVKGKEESVDDYLDRFKLIISKNLGDLIRSTYPSIRVVVYDSILPWAQDMVERMGVEGAPFFTQSCTVSTIYYHVNQGVLKIPVEGTTMSLPYMLVFGVDDLPSFINDSSSYPALWTLTMTQFSSFDKVNWVFF